MAVAGENVLLVAGRLAGWIDAPRLPPLLEGLSRLDLPVELVCLANDGVLQGNRPGVFECPGLAKRWQRRGSVRRLRRSGGVRPPDLLHILQTELSRVALLLAEHWRIPYILTIDEFVPVGGRVRISPRWCRGLVAPSRALADDLVDSLGVPDHMVAVVPPSLSVAEPVPVRPGDAHVPVVGAACPLVPGSGLAVFLDAAQLVTEAGLDAEFVVAGQGPGEGDLRRRAERLRITERVTFVGSLSAAGTLWQVLDVFCQTSLVPTVGRPLAHALARGIPSIASDVPGIHDWTMEWGKPAISQGNAGVGVHRGSAVRLVPAGDAEALAAAIRAAVGQLGQGGRGESGGFSRARERFSPEREARELSALYRRRLERVNPTKSIPSTANSAGVPGFQGSRLSSAESRGPLDERGELPIS